MWVCLKLNSVDSRLFPPKKETSSHWSFSFGTDSWVFTIKMHQMIWHETNNIVLTSVYKVIVTFNGGFAFACLGYCFPRCRTTGKFYASGQWKGSVLLLTNVSSGSPLLKIAWSLSPFVGPNINRKQTLVEVYNFLYFQCKPILRLDIDNRMEIVEVWWIQS